MHIRFLIVLFGDETRKEYHEHSAFSVTSP